MKTLLFEASDYGYEEGWDLKIYEIDGKFFVREEGNTVFSGDYDLAQQVTQEEALEYMLDLEEYED